jgi:FSR family fosmidomycin resistance protein-like MFS transporter
MSKRLQLGALTWAHFLNDGYVNYLPAILPLLLSQFNIPIVLVGTLIFATQGIGSLMQPLTGLWADHRGGRGFVLAGLAMSAIGASLLGIAPNYPVLLLLLVVIGLGNSFFHPQALATTRSLTERHEAIHMSLFLVGGELGRGIWPGLAGLLVAWLGLHGLWVFAIPGALTIALLSIFAPSLNPRIETNGIGVTQPQHGKIFALVGFVGLRGMVSYGVATFTPILWHSQGGSLIGGASLISIMLIVGIFGNLSGGFLADRFSRRGVLMASSLLSALFLVYFLYSRGILLWFTLALLGVAVFSTAPITMLIGQDLFPSNRSLASGIALGIGNALGAAAVFGLGFVAGHFSLRAPFWWMAALALLGLPLAWMLTSRE